MATSSGTLSEAQALAAIKAAGFPHNGHRAVPQGHHLAKAAGLAFAGH